jgi:HTH-type transcriptional regulator/antitoxin HigA
MVNKATPALDSEAAYEAALDEIERYFGEEPQPGTAEAERFDSLSQLIEDYENRRWPIEPLDPTDGHSSGASTIGS